MAIHDYSLEFATDLSVAVSAGTTVIGPRVYDVKKGTMRSTIFDGSGVPPADTTCDPFEGSSMRCDFHVTEAFVVGSGSPTLTLALVGSLAADIATSIAARLAVLVGATEAIQPAIAGVVNYLYLNAHHSVAPSKISDSRLFDGIDALGNPIGFASTGTGIRFVGIAALVGGTGAFSAGKITARLQMQTGATVDRYRSGQTVI